MDFYTSFRCYSLLEVAAPEFDAVEQGYPQPEAQPLVITSTGDTDATISSVALKGFCAGYFMLNRTDGAAIAAGSTDNTTYTVRPRVGIPAGAYSATVIVTYNNGATATADLSFTVEPARTYTLTVAAPAFAAETTGYAQPEAQPLTIQSLGNSDATVTSVTLDGDDADCFTLNRTEGGIIAAGSTDSTTWTVRPNAGLENGDYHAAVNVHYNNGETVAAGLSFMVRQYRIELEESPYGQVYIPGVANAGERVSFYAFLYEDYWDDYQFVELVITDAAGNTVENDRQSFVMPAGNVTAQPIFMHPEPIAFEMDEEIQIMMVQTYTHSWSTDTARALIDEGVWFTPLCNEEGYMIDSVTVTAQSGAAVECLWFADRYEDYIERYWGFNMPGEPVTVRITKALIPAFGVADFTLPADIRVIEANAFEGDALITAVDAHSCMSIGAEAFRDCDGLTQIRVHADCEIDNTAFAGCGMVFVYAPSGGAAETSCEDIENCMFVAETLD